MEEMKCEVCKKYFEAETKNKICNECKFKISQMSTDIQYKDRIKDKLLLFWCSKCLWCREIDFTNKKIYCSLPRCKRYVEVENEKI